jgi:hypothetical protein
LKETPPSTYGFANERHDLAGPAFGAVDDEIPANRPEQNG